MVFVPNYHLAHDDGRPICPATVGPPRPAASFPEIRDLADGLLAGRAQTLEHCVSDAEGYQAIAEAEVEAASHRPPERTLGQKLRVPLMAAGVAVVLGVVAYSLLTGGRFESTDDAYVQTARTAISASNAFPACFLIVFPPVI